MNDQPHLSSKEAEKLFLQYGPNELPPPKTTSLFKRLLSQFTNFLSGILLLSAALSFLVGDITDSFLILTILLLNGLLGFWQDYKASREIEELRKLEVLSCRVIRDGQEQEISASKLVPGDLVLVESGSRIPADGSIVRSIQLTTNESSLTGESVSVLKTTQPNENEVFFGTIVVAGRGSFRVTQTGRLTRFGKIAITLSEVKEEDTPLEVAINSLGKKLAFIAVAASGLVFLLAMIRNPHILSNQKALLELVFTSTSLAVAAVPEGLPAVITIILAIGAHRLYKHRSLVRKMASVESLGAATVICTDKTGTLTKNEMRVKNFVPYLPSLRDDLLTASVLCNSASLLLKEDGKDQEFEVLGDTTEGALLLWSKEQKVNYEALRESGKLLDEQPFDSNKRVMSVLWRSSRGTHAFVKGAPEKVIQLCSLSEKEKTRLTDRFQEMAAKGLRVLALAQKETLTLGVLKEMNFLGLFGIADLPRPEAREAITKAHDAGIVTVMITGDNELTAEAIAQEIGLIQEGQEVITGEQLDSLSDEEFSSRLDLIKVYARCSPEHKLRIVQAFQKRGEIVAVTGDGVNDSLALKQAHIGIAMGQMGTDVAKEASDIILLDDNFATIVNAIEQGRLIYNNIVKVIKFLVATNLAEVLVILIAVLLGFPSPLLPIQILWINLVTDGLPALSLAVDHGHSGIMHQKPRPRGGELLNNQRLSYVIVSGLIMAILSVGSFIFAYSWFGLEAGRAVVFTTLIFLQMIFIFILRGKESLVSNRYLLLTVGLVVISQILILTLAPLQGLFKITF
ncbi:hypothetical protein A2631_03695 [Candidatus Daviesbacteria bacterium RIFCSPHIGHO2_01_FULL_44_29]|uniref:Cation-transporting P-type ATPase N-terminal domain-containing protein n=1 Tax=Candidatus Daviesbacteria bacterium RIFCSPHIGHO2_02_FULL_43_12 TaxID=1797776 RepID=A0A1F5KHS3_9BACT|nr:MAG: hypothetical protein A2631_03695 [Candidatus Daviesbacteria bacterium RIFCSPHIGHO2_01_FULL_44_29]OGE39823.1 MAG: hypothetical protein A3E86_04610 [Candidatus Daviesbacteria bacterium RIFCSPHIGHO2_12_FULL_47_45]OGE40462.1 MAG: hypothetical protein A3D25_00155 [Candidatus Daviesbacteria bacterium RIFCSPHIGHO2_02_FULL_43_12]OGE70013.1 MAG: hypothetical protein A3B55_04960 [Candidatus Daviesbacteria bacterium RIFCSPLOWO2_01_FULL_43_15]